MAVQSTERPPPDEEFRRWYTIGWRDFSTAAYGMGGLPLALMLFVPRTCLSFFVVGLAMVARAVARLVQTASSYERKANLRILIITDYMPPQTHGIAIRFRHYIDYMRRAGHEVQVFCTNTVRETESSFDHPNLPSIVNPYNVKNKMAYSAGAPRRAGCTRDEARRRAQAALPACSCRPPLPRARARAKRSARYGDGEGEEGGGGRGCPK